MTITQILDQAKALSVQERKELAKLLIDTLDTNDAPRTPKTGAEIVAILKTMESIKFVDSHLEDPVEWTKAQRRKRVDQLNSYRDGSA